MFICMICHFDAPLDDTVVSGPSGRCICLRCYLRETESMRPMAPSLQRDLSDVLLSTAFVD
jgi:hypothetical protein